MAAGDLTGDGQTDLVVGNNINNQLLINTGAGYYERQTSARLPLNDSIEETREWKLLPSPRYKLQATVFARYNYSYGNSNREFNSPALKLSNEKNVALTHEQGTYFLGTFNSVTEEWESPVQLPASIDVLASMTRIDDEKLLLTHVVEDDQTKQLYTEIFYL